MLVRYQAALHPEILQLLNKSSYQAEFILSSIEGLHPENCGVKLVKSSRSGSHNFAVGPPEIVDHIPRS